MNITNSDNCDVCIKPEFIGEKENKEKKELGVNTWHGIKYDQPIQLCQSIQRGQECTRKQCNRVHDIAKYLQERPAPLDIECPNIKKFGYCEYSYSCIFSHPVEQQDKAKNSKPEYLNNIALKQIKDYDYSQPSTQKEKKFDPRGKLILAPMCTVGTMPFRRWCKRFGCDVTCSEMIFARGLVGKQIEPMEIAKLRRHPEEDIFGLQLTGNASELSQCIKMLNELCTYDYVELNAGCPQEVATDRKCGFQIAQEGKIKVCMEKMAEQTTKQNMCLSLKTRIADFQGESRIEALLAKELVAGVDNITLHGRSAKQRYQKNADYKVLEKFGIDVKQSKPDICFTVNGDLFDVPHYLKVLEDGWTDAFLIGRGALVKPWIFQEFKEKRVMDPSSQQRKEWMQEFANLCIEYFGTDRMGIERAREQFLENYVYMCRYVPVGILESPQLLNQRNVVFKGRDDLETLFGSQNVEDWVKVTEMFFGPVPPGFLYQPKHKSKGSYQK